MSDDPVNGSGTPKGYAGEVPADPAIIGETDQPVRALAFAGGGYDTILQLGVTHALLVSRGRPPDFVVGISAGAVNAVALAEILQAGSRQVQQEKGTADVRQRLLAQIARFRKIFEAYMKAPGEQKRLLPDILQIETQRPLAPAALPIFSDEERRARSRGLRSQSGLVNLYNQLLRVNLPIGIYTRLLRCYLGLKAAGEVPSQLLRWLHRVAEGARGWMLLGSNLAKFAPVAPAIIGVATLPRTKRRRVASVMKGATAGQLIFAGPAWTTIRRLGWVILALALLSAVWSFVTALGFGAITILLALTGWLLEAVVGRKLWTEGAIWSVALLSGSFSMFSVLKWGGSRTFEGIKTIANLILLLLGWGAFSSLFVGLVLVILSPVWPSLLPLKFWLVLLGWACFGILASLGAAFILFRARVIPLRILRKNAIDASLLDPHPVREFFIRLFDPDYYGSVDLDEIVERALGRETGIAEPESRNETQGKTIGSYVESAEPKIHVGIVAADISTGNLTVLPHSLPVIDSLLAATAVVPFFPPCKFPATKFPTGRSNPQGSDGELKYALDDEGFRYFIDGTNIANEPTRNAISHLRRKIHPEASAVYMYSVAPLPFSQPELGPEQQASGRRSLGPYRQLIDVVLRALELRRFRYASLERKLTRLYTRVMKDKPVAALQTQSKNYLRTHLFPIEPDHPMRVNQRIFEAASEQHRRRIVAETVAHGCRLALEAMMRPAIAGIADSESIKEESRTYLKFVPCRSAVAAHLRSQDCSDDVVGIPGSSEEGGPGLVEVCRHCRLRYTPRNSTSAKDGDGEPPRNNEKQLSLHLGQRELKGVGEIPDWPIWNSRGGQPRSAIERIGHSGVQKELPRNPSNPRRKGVGRFHWPRERNGVPGDLRPTVSLLFSGGVFRGVYQMGVLNALNEVGVTPDIVAGASVGSVTAAMACAVFRSKDPSERHLRIARLAATYLAVDRLVLTDRFADFVRKLTIRAAQTRFSLREADKLFRQYDRARTLRFGEEARSVVAGLERLLYVSPFELRDLLAALRLRKPSRAMRLLRSYFQELLERNGVGDEILGAEPLELLIQEHVIGESARDEYGGFDTVPLDIFLSEPGTVFLATVTNLTSGCLEILGDWAKDEHGVWQPKPPVSLSKGLLASSAFPGIFRPRWSWELMTTAPKSEMYVDGGLMDNLPLDAVTQFLFRAAEEEQITRRPGAAKPVPHLLLTASLRPDPEPKEGRELRELAEDWLEMLKRANALGYNDKANLFRNAQRAIRQIGIAQGGFKGAELEPLDLEVMIVKPNWVSGTYAFHPMLGFKRKKQAQSIAHGCASTLLQMAQFRSESVDCKAWCDAWGIKAEHLPDIEHPVPGSDPGDLYHPQRVEPGRCWYRPGRNCPFSRESLQHSELRKQPNTVNQLVQIYSLCGLRRTHCPDIPGRFSVKRLFRRRAYEARREASKAKEEDMANETYHPYRRLSLDLPLAVAALIAIALVGLGAPGVRFSRPTTWFVILVLMTGFAVVVGHGITGVWRGILIDARNKMSLSRLQLLSWTLVVLSALFTAVLTNVGQTEAPLEIDIPSQLWVLLGISTASMVASPAILSTKRDRKADATKLDATVRTLKQRGYGDVVADPDSILMRNKEMTGARWADLVKGDEFGNAASVDVGKLQMLLFTFILVMGYSSAIASLFAQEGVISQLPAVADGMNTLLGISHTGYLANKAVSHSPEREPQTQATPDSGQGGGAKP